MVAGVAITPTLRLRVARAAAEAPGRITPRIGTAYPPPRAPSATAVDVLQATTIALTSRSASRSSDSVENARTSSSGRTPYGARALSPRYSVDSAGVRRRISRSTVRPPTPESKTPIGRGSGIGGLGPPGGRRDAARVHELGREARDVLADPRFRAG